MFKILAVPFFCLTLFHSPHSLVPYGEMIAFEHLLYIPALCIAWILGSVSYSHKAALLFEEASKNNFPSVLQNLVDALLNINDLDKKSMVIVLALIIEHYL